MKTILVTGGTDGIGKGLVLYYLKKDYQVIAVGSSKLKGERLKEEAGKLKKEKNLLFMQANLSLISENQRVVQTVKEKYTSLDALILCAASLKPQERYSETGEGFEFTFALYYLSRYVLSYALKELMEKAEHPFVVNVCAPGMKGQVNWSDIQFKTNYNGQKVQFHGSRLNDLLGVAFTENDSVKKIRYILFNPMAVKTPGAENMFHGKSFTKRMTRLYYKYKGKTIEETAEIVVKDIQKTAKGGLTAFKQDDAVALSMETFDKDNAEKLSKITSGMLKNKS